MYSNTVFWHRRDLRIQDNAGLHKALTSSRVVQPIFIFDSNILSKLSPNDQRVLFIHQEITRLSKEYGELGVDLKIYHGDPKIIIPNLRIVLHCFLQILLGQSLQEITPL
jgi:deoxyribodipyrimidine photo-lyase